MLQALEKHCIRPLFEIHFAPGQRLIQCVKNLEASAVDPVAEIFQRPREHRLGCALNCIQAGPALKQRVALLVKHVQARPRLLQRGAGPYFTGDRQHLFDGCNLVELNGCFDVRAVLVLEGARPDPDVTGSA